jgi:hypothetical protein
MIDPDSFLTTLYVMVDDFCKTSLPLEVHPGPHAALTRSEGVTLAIFGQWQGFGSERGFYHIPSLLVVECVTTHRKPPEVRICKLSIQSAVGTHPPSTSTPHCPACWARR